MNFLKYKNCIKCIYCYEDPLTNKKEYDQCTHPKVKFVYCEICNSRHFLIRLLDWLSQRDNVCNGRYFKDYK